MIVKTIGQQLSSESLPSYQIKNFLLPTDIETMGMDGNEELRLPLLSLYDNSEVTLWFYNRNCVKIMTKNMGLAGNLIQSLTKFLNIEGLMVYAEALTHSLHLKIIVSNASNLLFSVECPFSGRDQRDQPAIRSHQWLSIDLHSTDIRYHAEEEYGEELAAACRRRAIIQ